MRYPRPSWRLWAAGTIGAAVLAAAWLERSRARRRLAARATAPRAIGVPRSPEPGAGVPAVAPASHALVVYEEAPLPVPGGPPAIHVPAARSRPVRLRGIRWLPPIAALLVAAIAGVSAYREYRDDRQVELAVGGMADRAVHVMRANGCAGCHTIPGVPGAQGQVGPRLDETLATRRYLAGVIPNNSDNLVRWVRSAREVVPHTAMPSTGISEQDARDIAAYLYAMR